MVSYNAAGYDDLRSYAYNNWNWIAILDDGGTEHLRWDLLSNANVSVDADASSNPITYTVTITGQDLVDAGASLPVTLDKYQIYKTSGATTPMGEDQFRDSGGTTTTATLEATGDEVDLQVSQEIPPQ